MILSIVKFSRESNFTTTDRSTSKLIEALAVQGECCLGIQRHCCLQKDSVEMEFE